MKNLAPLVLALSLCAPAAFAATTDETVALRVNRGSLDLSQPEGASLMLTRLERASLDACGASGFSFREVQAEVRRSACYHDSLARAVADLGAPTVTERYQAQLARVAAD